MEVKLECPFCKDSLVTGKVGSIVACDASYCGEEFYLGYCPVFKEYEVFELMRCEDDIKIISVKGEQPCQQD